MTVRMARVTWTALVATLAIVSGGCFWIPGTPNRPDPEAPVSGPVPYVENCQRCHRAPVGAAYAQSLHSAMGIRCGQCHTPDGHPNFAEPIRDGKCGGCHLPQFEQTLASKHFASRQLRALDHDRAARATLRRDGFTVATTGGRRFAGDASSGDLGGRVCLGCHYDEHRLGLAPVGQANFCTQCHVGREDHFPMSTPGSPNRCTECHVRAGRTVSGQTINTHRFARP